MKNNKMYTKDEITKLISNGKSFFLAADQELLKSLPKGKWVGGTIPYFMSDEGGVISKDKVFATELPDYVKSINIKMYTRKFQRQALD
jgi:hypothetical protein